MNMPKIHSYMDPPKANATMVVMGNVSAYFSYETLVAFRVFGQPLIVRKNEWNNTTAKHLNQIDGGNKERRIDEDAFKQAWHRYTREESQ